MADTELRTATEAVAADMADGDLIPITKAAAGAGLFRVKLATLKAYFMSGAGAFPALAGNKGKVLTVKSDESGVEWDTPAAGGGGGGSSGGTATVTDYPQGTAFRFTAADAHWGGDSYVGVGDVQFLDAAGAIINGKALGIASSIFSDAWKPEYAFDGVTNGNNGWICANGAGAGEFFIGVFPNAMKPHKLAIFPIGNYAQALPKKIKVEFADASGAWINCGTLDTASPVAGTGQTFDLPQVTYAVAGGGSSGGSGGIEEAPEDGLNYVRRNGTWVALKNVAYRYRIRNDAQTAGGYMSLAELRFYDASGVIAPTGAFSNGDYGGYPATNVADGDANSFWISSNGSGVGQLVGYKEGGSLTAGAPIAVMMRASPNGGEQSRVPLSFTVQLSTDDGVSWADAWSVANIPAFAQAEQRIINKSA